MNINYTEFKSAFESDLLSLVKQLTSSQKLFGLAIMIGEDIDQMDCIAVTLSEEEREKLSPADSSELQYIADEWPSWHYEAFKSTSQTFKKLLSNAPESNPDSCEYTSDQIQFMDGLYDTYLSVMMDHRTTELSGIPFTMLYSSDCGRNFMGKSVQKLNAGEIVEGALKVYSYNGDSNF
jgi:hypothetical protein